VDVSPLEAERVGECARFARSKGNGVRNMGTRVRRRAAHMIGASSAAVILAAGVTQSQQEPAAPTPYAAAGVPPTAAAIEQTEVGHEAGARLVESFDGLGLGFNG